jgi:hypothetical protein
MLITQPRKTHTLKEYYLHSWFGMLKEFLGWSEEQVMEWVEEKKEG